MYGASAKTARVVDTNYKDLDILRLLGANTRARARAYVSLEAGRDFAEDRETWCARQGLFDDVYSFAKLFSHILYDKIRSASVGRYCKPTVHQLVAVTAYGRSRSDNTQYTSAR